MDKLALGRGRSKMKDSWGLVALPKLSRKHSLCSAAETASFGTAHPLQSYKER
jgi:hypothetical protein